MKKLIISCEILVFIIFLAKIVTVGDIIRNPEAVERYFSVNQALADSPEINRLKPQVQDVSEDGLLKERELMASLLEKQKELEARENLLKADEKKLVSLKDEILSKIDKLREMETKLTILVESVNKVDQKRYQDLAKVYESAPPAQASSMLEKMDKKTAAAIIMNMRSKKAGAIWGHINPRKAVEITNEITKIQSFSKSSSK